MSSTNKIIYSKNGLEIERKRVIIIISKDILSTVDASIIWLYLFLRRDALLVGRQARHFFT